VHDELVRRRRTPLANDLDGPLDVTKDGRGQVTGVDRTVRGYCREIRSTVCRAISGPRWRSRSRIELVAASQVVMR